VPTVIVADGVCRQVIINAMSATRTLRENVISLPLPINLPAADMTSAIRLAENIGAFSTC
tara:strand:+ start:1144 stop:1323 length:180 start_codon:yes stop_codon:yes gene_type:complete